MRHYSKETKFKSGRIIRDTYVNPFKDCNNIKTLSHILNLINQGKFCPTMDHDLPYGPHLKHSKEHLERGNAPGWDGFDPGCLPQSVWNTLYQDAIQCYVELREKGQNLPPLPNDSNDPLRGLKYLEGCLKPENLITIAVAVSQFDVSAVTIQRNIDKGKLSSYRPNNAKPNSQHMVDAKEIAALYPRRKKV